MDSDWLSRFLQQENIVLKVIPTILFLCAVIVSAILLYFNRNRIIIIVVINLGVNGPLNGKGLCENNPKFILLCSTYRFRTT